MSPCTSCPASPRGRRSEPGSGRGECCAGSPSGTTAQCTSLGLVPGKSGRRRLPRWRPARLRHTTATPGKCSVAPPGHSLAAPSPLLFFFRVRSECLPWRNLPCPAPVPDARRRRMYLLRLTRVAVYSAPPGMPHSSEVPHPPLVLYPAVETLAEQNGASPLHDTTLLGLLLSSFPACLLTYLQLHSRLLGSRWASSILPSAARFHLSIIGPNLPKCLQHIVSKHFMFRLLRSDILT